MPTLQTLDICIYQSSSYVTVSTRRLLGIQVLLSHFEYYVSLALYENCKALAYK